VGWAQNLVDAVREQLKSQELAGQMEEIEEAIRQEDADSASRPLEAASQPMLDPQPGKPRAQLFRHSGAEHGGS